MGIYFGIDGWENDASIDVPNPGHGELSVFLPAADPDQRPRADLTLHGRQVGALLEQLVALALSKGLAGRIDALRTSLTVGEAKLLLPVAQRAAVLAAGGGNAYEVLFEDDGDDGATPRWCKVCGEGAIYVTQECQRQGGPPASCARTDWCDLHGHTWFAGRPPVETTERV